jgi:arginyl-tRNA--protein-N-Asp/Glu arginylyltransferase
MSSRQLCEKRKEHMHSLCMAVVRRFGHHLNKPHISCDSRCTTRRRTSAKYTPFENMYLTRSIRNRYQNRAQALATYPVTGAARNRRQNELLRPGIEASGPYLLEERSAAPG